jgi:hypothetical protein
VIPFDYITEWRAEAPWIDDAQVEQDLVISRALVEIFRHPALADSLARRGGTALSKLQLRPPHGTRKTSISCRPQPSLPGR